ncbi:GEVED domain-containing protein [uncultured Lutibacter sp.]|uniref:GEVED domain-containing protein n=1 Tax=uncultured Lutibacter sp. TaxID=437739 RepID=UPI0026056544|nr:GEVED domain-containing protein [uncultured Lutibacter sp.]
MMKKLLFLTFILSFTFGFSQSVNPWLKSSKNDKKNVLQNRNQLSNNFEVYNLDVSILRNALTNSPKRSGYLQKSSTIIEFPNAEGQFERFSVFEASVMHPDLQAKYPNIRSYAGKGIDNPSATIRFSISQLGLKTMTTAAGKSAVFIEPYTSDFTQYMVYSKKSKDASLNSFECLVKEDVSNKIKSQNTTVARPNADDSTLRTFRLAMSASGEYTTYFGGTKANSLAAINNTMTRVNGIFEIDFGVTLELIANTDAVIYTSANSDPYTTSLNSQLQSTLSSVIGESNYDIGHLVHQGGNNGNAGCIGCVCVNNQKGSGYTSYGTPEGDNFDVDYVAHEMGHQFGGNHTWTFNGNEGANAQMEPGSGSTIMGYAGITGATDIQAHSDAYFHAISIQQVTNYVKTTSCQTNTATGNNVPTALAGGDFTIPKSTPFMLTGDGADADGNNSLSFCWEQMDENNAATTYPSTTATTGIAFRSFSPTTLKSRSFPQLSTVLAGSTSTQWESTPSVARTLNFRLTVRDNVAGGGANNSDDMVVNVNSSAGPFVVSTPNTNITWNANQLQTVTWDVAGTAGAAVNCQTVNILLSTDGGNTYPITIASGIANNGSAQITVPNNIGTQNRIKVEAADNIFYDVSNSNFTIAGEVVCNATVPTGLAFSNVSASGATLTWNSVSGATYNVQYRQVGTSTWTTVNSGVTSTNLTGLNTLTQYEAQVQSVCTSGSSAFSTSVNFTTLDQVLTYCASKGNSVADEYISNVQIGTINNSSNGSNGYTDYTSISTNLNKGDAITITVTPTWTGTVYSEGYGVWIDYNKDGDFTDAGEQVWTKAASKTTPVSGTFTVPSGAVTGTTTMRVSMKYNGIPTACEAFSYGEVEDYTVVLMDSAPDTQAPTAATLTSSNITETTVDLSWSGSTDNIGVTGYDIYKDNTLLTSITGNSYQATGLTDATTYNFKVKAKDASGNISTDSNIVSVTTLTAPDTQAPTAATLTHSNITETSVDLAWSGSTDNIGVTGYDIYKDNVLLTSVTGTSYQVIGLTNGTVYNFKVNAKDAAGNISTDSNTVSITTVTSPDTQAPTAPVLTSNNITETTVDLVWSSSTDNVGVTGYDVYKNNVLLTSVTGTSYQATGLTSGSSYNFNVKAKDAAGNISANSNTETITTVTPDTQAPSSPIVTTSNITQTTVNLSWNASTDNVGVTGYDVYKNNVLLTSVTGTSYQATLLTAATSYNFNVRAKDAAGNISNSNTVTISTLTQSLTYCASKGNSVADEYISKVQIGTINNSSAGGNGYSDHTSISTNLDKGEQATITITPKWNGSLYNEGYSVWIDYNQDGDFTDAGEQVWTKSASQTTPVSGSFTIPTSATNGATRMRVSMKYNGIPTACEAFSYGEVEDYTVVLNTATPDTQAPTSPTLTTSNITQTSVNLAWSGSTDNVGVTGYDVYKNNVLLTSVTGTTYQVTSLTAATSYNFKVKAKDAAGNTSTDSNIATISTLTQSLTYCASKGNSVADEYISNVQIGTINNSSTGGNGYSDHTSLSTNLDKGAQVTITITPKWTGTLYNEGYGVWIDYNQDGDFTDTGEQVWTKAASKTTPVSGSFTVSASATNGATRMRVSMKYNGIPTACEAFSYGEVEDYTVVISGGTARFVDSSFETEINKISIYPNPVKGEFLTVKLTKSTNASYNIANVLGQTVKVGNLNNVINVGDLKTGIYIININDGDKIMSKKFIKQ